MTGWVRDPSYVTRVAPGNQPYPHDTYKDSFPTIYLFSYVKRRGGVERHSWLELRKEEDSSKDTQECSSEKVACLLDKLCIDSIDDEEGRKQELDL